MHREGCIQDDTSFGRWLRCRRKALDLTQDDLAGLVGCSVITIRKVEAGERRPGKLIAERLADCLAIPPEQRAQFIRFARPGTVAHVPDLLAPTLPVLPLPSAPRGNALTPSTIRAEHEVAASVQRQEVVRLRQPTFSAKFKMQIVLDLLTGARTISQICRDHDLNDHLVRHWRSEFLEHAETAFGERTERHQQVQRIAELEGLVRRLTLELEIAKAHLPA